MNNDLIDRFEKIRPFFIRECLNLFPPRIRYTLETVNFEPLTFEPMYVYGSNGTGKTTHAAIRLLGNIKRESDLKTHKFVSVPAFLHELRQNFANDGVEDLINIYSKCKFLVFDDIGSEKVTDWVYQTLFLVVNYRYEHMLSTIFTSNLDLDELAARLGDTRISSRIQEMCRVFELSGKDRRSN
jgi:DNA replication protein DnaC